MIYEHEFEALLIKAAICPEAPQRQRTDFGYNLNYWPRQAYKGTLLEYYFLEHESDEDSKLLYEGYVSLRAHFVDRTFEITCESFAEGVELAKQFFLDVSRFRPGEIHDEPHAYGYSPGKPMELSFVVGRSLLC